MLKVPNVLYIQVNINFYNLYLFCFEDDSVLVAAKSLMNHQTPLRWQNVWEGSENPMKYLSAIVNKALKLQKLIENPSSDDILEEDVDLTIFFQPEKFLKAFKQLSSR